MDEQYVDMLVDEARKASENAYAPYSEYKVGAAVLTVSGNIYTGCNVENAAYPVGLCAERAAFATAIAAGERNFEAIAIYSDSHNMPYPCGMCRQFMSEFNPDLQVIIVSEGGYESKLLSQLLPFGFNI